MEVFGAFLDQEWESLSNMFSFEDSDHFLLPPPEINESNYDANPNTNNANFDRNTHFYFAGGDVNFRAPGYGGGDLFLDEEINNAIEPMDFIVPSVFSGGNSEPQMQLKRKLESPEHLFESPEKVTRVSGEGAKSKRIPRSKKSKKPENEETSNNGNGSACSSEGCESINGGSSSPESKGKSKTGKGPATDPQSIYARKRRERINERLKTLQTLVPNGTKVDISTMLEEAVDYVKFLQLQIKLLSSDDTWMFAPIAYNGMDMGLYQEIVPNL